MTERERLIELLCNAPLGFKTFESQYYKSTISKIADHLIANGVIVPPCKVGDTVYYNDNNYPYKRNTLTFECMVSCFDFDFDTGEHIAVLNVLVVGHFFKRIAVKFSDFGKTVFLTKEEAESKLKEINKNKYIKDGEGNERS